MDVLSTLLLGGAGTASSWQALDQSLRRSLSGPQPPEPLESGAGARHWAARRDGGSRECLHSDTRATAAAAAFPSPFAGCVIAGCSGWASNKGDGCGEAWGGGGGSVGSGRRWLIATAAGPEVAVAAPPLASLTTHGSFASATAAAAAASAAATTASTAGTAAPVTSGGNARGAAKHQQQEGKGASGQLRDFSGTWIKDRERSDSMEPAMNLMHLNGIVRQAVKLVRGVRIDQQPESFSFTVFSVISWFKVREVFPMSGEQRAFKRRDLRRGKALGWVEPQGPDMHIQLEWGEPHGGTGTDHFRLISEDELHIESLLRVGGDSVRYVTVYNRKPDRRHAHSPSHPHSAGHDHDHDHGHDNGSNHQGK